jgi:tetratricopeptide (TPR) repeat protein
MRWTERAPSAPAFRALTMAYGMAGKVDDAVASARRALELDMTGLSRVALAEALNLAGRYAEVEALLRPHATPSASKFDRAEYLPPLASALAYQGRRREALRLLDDYPEEVEGKLGVREAMKLDLLFGDGPSEALLRRARALSRNADPHVVKGLAVALAWLGDLEAAAYVAGRLPPEVRQLYEAAVAWRTRDLARAMSIDRDLAKSAGYEGRAPALWMLAHAAFDAGKDDEVISSADALRTAASGGWRTWGLPDAELLAARALDRQGERAKARARVDRVLAVWKHADADLPMLARARELRAQLGP